MKKFLSMMLALTMVMSASITAVFAEDTVPEVSSASVTKVEAEATGKTVDTSTGVSAVRASLAPVFTVNCTEPGVYKLTIRIWDNHGGSRSTKVQIGTAEEVTYSISTSYCKYIDYSVYAELTTGSNAIKITGNYHSFIDYIELAPVAAIPTAAGESMRIEAESLGSGTAGSGNRAGFIQFGNSTATFSVYATEAGAYKLMIPFMDGIGTDSRTFSVSINGGTAVSTSVATMTNISSYTVTDVELTKGVNKITITPAYWHYIDYIELSKSAPEFPEATNALNVNKPVFSAKKTMVGSGDGVTFIKKVSTLDEAKKYYNTSASDEYKNMIYVSSPVAFKKSNTGASYNLILGTYDSDQRLTEAVTYTVSMTANNSGNYNHLREISVEIPSEGTSVKAFSWNSLSDLTPYCEAAEIK